MATTNPKRLYDMVFLIVPDKDEQAAAQIVDEFRKLLTSTIHQTYPPHEWERFEAHFGGLMTMWATDNAHLAS